MIQVIIIFILLLFSAIIFLAIFIVGIIAFIKRQCGRSLGRSLKVLKRAGIAMGMMVITMGGFFIFSRITAHTPAILNKEGKQLKGSVAELTQVTLNGRKEWITIRG